MLFHRLVLLFVLVPTGALLPGAVRAENVVLAPYRAVEDLTLDPAQTNQDIAAVSGRLVTEFTGSACAGYTTSTRMVVQAVDSDGTRKVNDARTLTFETVDGRLDFDNTSYTDGELDQASQGTARRASSTITVELAKPDEKTVTFDAGLVFPTEQVARIIEAARAGKRFLSFTAYDGLDDGESPAPTSMVIGKGSTDPSDIGDETAVAKAGIAGLRHWPLTVSYFDKDATADQQADFTLVGILYENGVMREQRLDFGTFSLVGKMVSLEMLPSKPCP